MDMKMKTIDIMGEKIAEENLREADYILNVYTDKTGLLDLEKIDSCYKYGYDAVSKNIKDIKKVLEY
jgi:ribosomal protein S2